LSSHNSLDSVRRTGVIAPAFKKYFSYVQEICENSNP